MAKEYGPNIGLIVGADLGEEWFDELKLFLWWMDFFATRIVLEIRQAPPPGTPGSGDTYLVHSSPTDDWVGHANQIARYHGTVWEFIAVPAGCSLSTPAINNRFFFNGTEWYDSLA